MTVEVTEFVTEVVRPLFVGYGLQIIIPALLVFALGWAAFEAIMGSRR